MTSIIPFFLVILLYRVGRGGPRVHQLQEDPSEQERERRKRGGKYAQHRYQICFRLFNSRVFREIQLFQGVLVAPVVLQSQGHPCRGERERK